ncbi:MAG: twin-arginine translocation signal domain-containing protein [Gammaproteobacteria bacterium]|nr:twin-arginine translocation signal domain-containing protein [Gammaproteobacteria bacterium]
MKNELEKKDRRAFLKGASATAVAVGTGAVSANVLADATSAEIKPVVKEGYRETDHVREYYRLARF